MTQKIWHNFWWKWWLQNVNQKLDSCFYRWSLSCWTFWSWLSCGSSGKKSRWRNVHLDAGSFFLNWRIMCQLSQKGMQNGWFFTTCLAMPRILHSFFGMDIGQSCQSCILGIRCPTVPRDPMGGPWVEASACESLRSIIVATCRTCPLDLGWRERCVDVSYCQKLTYWYNFWNKLHLPWSYQVNLSASLWGI